MARKKSYKRQLRAQRAIAIILLIAMIMSGLAVYAAATTVQPAPVQPSGQSL